MRISRSEGEERVEGLMLVVMIVVVVVVVLVMRGCVVGCNGFSWLRCDFT